jgi:glycosyltransferase involved in cell wall biosynthesis
LRRAWGVTPEQLAVLYVGRLAPEKNLEALAEAFAGVRLKRPEAKLILVGDGPAARAMQSMCPDAVFAGMRSGEDLATHYASADLFLFPSLTETFGNVTPEAMASGLPVVAFDYAAAAQLVTPFRSGLLARFGDTASLIARATAIVQHPERLREMGREARHTAESMSWDRIIEQIESRFFALIDGERPARVHGTHPQPLAS